MQRRTIFVGFAIAGLTLAAGQHASAWGNGCIDGIQFPNEQSYNAYLATHPNAAVGVCTTTTTTVRSTPSTTTSPTTAPSSTSPATSISTPTTPSPATTVPPTSNVSVPPSTESSEQVPPNDMTCSSGCETPSTATVTSTPTQPSQSATSTPHSTLPSTGPTDQTPIIVFAGLGTLGTGAAFMFAARRKQR